MKTLITAGLIGIVAGGGVAVAQTTATPTIKPMKGDTNNDGRLSRAEFVARAETRFTALDVNKDGALTREETRFGKGRGTPGRAAAMGQDGAPPQPGMGMRGPGRGMLRLDTDGDGRVTRADYDAQSGKGFARLDTNGDNTVDKAELAALPGGGRMAIRADADGNGVVTRAEYDALASQRFAQIDVNADGVLDTAELSTGPRRGGGRRANPGPIPPAPTGA